ncbi:MAG: aspartate aminotransferase family protein [Marivirga sp.]|nr:aspartate aminotransferase family protein [Marivirga sp.]
MENSRRTPIEISKEEFRKIGYQLIDSISEFIDSIERQPVTRGESPKQLQEILDNASLPDEGLSAEKIISRTSDLLFNHSLLNGHPKFLGYITSSPAPLGALADLLAASVNPNVGAQILSPIATEIEKQTVQWLSEFIGLAPGYGGILVSGGNMANFTAFVAGVKAKAPASIKEEGLSSVREKLVIYCSKTTHTWIEKAAVLFGLGSRAIRWIDTDASNKMDNAILESTIQNDLKNGCKPIMVIGTAGDVSTGVVDNLKAIASICKAYDLWFHIDGAYGIPAAVIPELKQMFEGLHDADSIALDPHKWLYSPLEAGCTLVKDPRNLSDTYSSHPAYYNFSRNEEGSFLNFYEYGFQNSRGFRALKVWMTLQQVGRTGYINMIGEDIRLSKLLFEKANDHPELEAVTQNLSIATLRYVPLEISGDADREVYLNKLNEFLLNDLQQGGEVFLSNAIVNGKYCLRGCIVNFRTTKKDIGEIIEVIVREGRKITSNLDARVKN